MDTFDRVAIKAAARKLLSWNRWHCVGVLLITMVINVLLSSMSAGLLGIIVSCYLTVTAGGFFLGVWHDKMLHVSDWFQDLFHENFLRRMGGMLWMQLKIVLWTMLFIVPGIIKSYAYFLTPYILHDCPNVSATDASRLSERIMRGHKLDVFITQMSFLGWIALSACTMGILGILHVAPYMELTFAGIYEELKQIALDEGVILPMELDGYID